MDNTAVQKQSSLTILVKSLLERLKGLHSYQPMMSNLVALGLIALIAVVSQIPWLFPDLAKHHHYVMMVLGLLAAIQIVRAATKSLLFPSICTLVAGSGIVILHFHLLALSVSLAYLQGLLLLGTLGLCVSIFHIR